MLPSMKPDKYMSNKCHIIFDRFFPFMEMFYSINGENVIFRQIAIEKYSEDLFMFSKDKG